MPAGFREQDLVNYATKVVAYFEFKPLLSLAGFSGLFNVLLKYTTCHSELAAVIVDRDFIKQDTLSMLTFIRER